MTYKLTAPDESFEPGDYAVFITIPARKYRSRLSNHRTFEDTQRAIRENELARKDTLGGLLPSNLDVVSYEVWRARGWDRVE